MGWLITICRHPWKASKSGHDLCWWRLVTSNLHRLGWLLQQLYKRALSAKRQISWKFCLILKNFADRIHEVFFPHRFLRNKKSIPWLYIQCSSSPLMKIQPDRFRFKGTNSPQYSNFVMWSNPLEQTYNSALYHTKTIYTLEGCALEQTSVQDFCSGKHPEIFHSFLEKQLKNQTCLILAKGLSP